MSLWLQAATEALHGGEYERFRTQLLPHAPSRVPDCLIRELEFAERRCRDNAKDRLFPIRFLWLMEANEQRMFGLIPLDRSLYHPEKLMEVWKQASADAKCRQEFEAMGFRFDFAEKAIELSTGWIYIGERLVEDLLEVETAAGVELLFPNPPDGERRPVFQEFKKSRSDEEPKPASAAIAFPAALRDFISITKWTFAKTYAKTWPHEYIVRERVDKNLFLQLVRHIRTNGYEGKFYQKPITYFDEAGMVYWTMGEPIEETDIINRCKKEDSYEARLKNGTLPEQERPSPKRAL